MALRWIPTKDYPALPASAGDDWVLLSGQFVVGRVFVETRGPNAGRVVWRLSGLHGLAAGKGIAPSVETARHQVLTGWREWQAWAGIRDAD